MVAAGWYPDPTRRFDLRYHNGSAWTADVSNDGERFVDPLGIDPSPAASETPAEPSSATNGTATASMVLGIVAVALGWMPFMVAVAIIAGILALLLGLKGRRWARTVGVGRGFATAGLIGGVIGLLVSIVGVVFSVAVWRAVERYEEPAAHTTGITACDLQGSELTARGDIRNDSDDVASFTVRVSFVRPGTDNARRSTLVRIDDVDPGATRSFETSVTDRQADLDCIVAGVKGPLPYGIDPGD